MAAGYDFLFKNGRQVDFATGKTFLGNIYVKDGLICSPPENEEAEAEHVFDVKENYLLPGLVDRHAHLYYGGHHIGMNADTYGPPNCITTAVDGGSVGWGNYELFYNAESRRYTTGIKGMLHVSAYGIHELPGLGECLDSIMIDEKQILKALRQYPESLRGLKIRVDANTLGKNGIRPLKRAVEIAQKATDSGSFCIMDVHCANLPDDVGVCDVAQVLRPGDIFTHVFQNRGQTIFETNGKVRDGIKEARGRGVIFDCCTGRIHWSFENFRKALTDDFLPDIISSDIIRESAYLKPGWSIIHGMNALMAVGMNEIDILKAVTYTPAKTLNILSEAGTLLPGRPADIAVLTVASLKTQLFDRFGGSLGTERLFLPLMTMKGGEVVFRQIFF
ncbi:MAG: amidohydrolase family protein [Spirochaetales bacterium]|nr:amidohydrolase family protein [Spirochaetales bacterium]